MGRGDQDGRDDGWRHAAKGTLKPWRDRLVHRLGGTLPQRGLTYEQLVHLLYPHLPDDLRAEVDAAASGRSHPGLDDPTHARVH